MGAATTDQDRRVAVIKALAHPTRLQIAQALRSGEQCVSSLRQLVGGDLSTVSKHLSLMRQAGWIDCRKEGLHIHYSLACTCLDDFLCCVDQLASKPNTDPCC